jgi:serine/threonine-protein kinase
MPVDATPMPSSSSEAALAAYRSGLEALRKGKGPSDGFMRAIELDPTLGAAHVQLTTLGLVGMTDIAREHLRKAEELRDRLGVRDRALLDAVEPVVGRQPSNWAETNGRLAALVERSPGDAELWYLLGVGHGNFDDLDVAVRDIERALAIDPGYAAASMYLALMLAYTGHSDKAHKVVERCLERDPSSLECLGFRVRLESEAGSCEAMESTSRQLIAATPTPVFGYAMLANALAARGRPVPTVREAVRLANEVPEGLPASLARDRERDMIASAWSFATFQGDFEAAERRAREYMQAVAGSQAQVLHGSAALDLASVLEEMGRSAEAAKVAGDYLDQRDAWEPDPRAEDGALGYDTTPMLLRIALHGGRLSAAEVTSRRDTWLAAWKARLTPVSRNFLWIYGFARVVDTPEDARAALDVLPTYGPLPPYRPWTLVDADMGRTYLLAGRTAEALDWIERATHKCLVLHYPIEHIRSYLLLGQAREAAGDKPGACASYRMILDRWGQAKPRSVTAEQARVRIQALDCKR